MSSQIAQRVERGSRYEVEVSGGVWYSRPLHEDKRFEIVAERKFWPQAQPARESQTTFRLSCDSRKEGKRN